MKFVQRLIKITVVLIILIISGCSMIWENRLILGEEVHKTTDIKSKSYK